MNLRAFQLAGLMVATAATVGQANVLISEVVYNEVGSNTAGEWIEIYNNGAAAVDLTNYKIGDEETKLGTSTTEALFQFPAGATIAAGGVQVIAVDAAVFNTNYGFLPTYQTNCTTEITVPKLTNYTPWDPDGGTLNMANTNDQAVLVNGTDIDSDAIVDAVSWGSSTFAFNPALTAAGDGISSERIDPTTDTDTGADWRFGSPSSPGTVPLTSTPEPASLAVLGFAAAIGLRRRGR
ncbi:MAG: hypothetical protein JWM57_2073 [Phycisphaerales bacterium]|nr:hypothetical protein [Phycisphaerales bacterium]